MSVALAIQLSTADYLHGERQAPEKHEYIQGQIYAMAGASREHNQLVFNLAGLLHAQLRAKPCSAFVADMRVRTRPNEAYFYPDLTVVCGELQFEDEHSDTLLNPSVIIEVLSPSTEGYDRGAKFAHYRRLASLQEYILVAQDRLSIEHYLRTAEGQWLLSEASEWQQELVIHSINCVLTVQDVYEKVLIN
ncbi:Uma2 family endonuclease [uncultured Thiothrix sp.]|uniref:Uma2 family endonuclease n=1 Tax=uncultured Thiothrix sp. TaxID=223185 RepID=UPI00261ADBF9|nr:Uma2 family endonuclease [uncultured Thiothrix sp.]HMT94190.1 Uma2 family endonuclease [Thiolinea sp.]